jgi:hypothetical protein
MNVRDLRSSAFLFLATFPVLAGPPPGVAPASPALHPPATPASPTREQAPITNVHTILALPAHSPDQLDFGAVWSGQVSRRTFVLTTNSSWPVTALLSPGPFWIVELRIMDTGGPLVGGVRFVARQVKKRVTFQPGRSMVQSPGVAPGTEIQLDIVFEPRFDISRMTAGPKSATMSVRGRGLNGAWLLPIPMHAMFNGLQVRTP